MEIFLRLATGASLIATEAAEASETGGFGLNLNILEANVINLLIAIALLVYFGRGFLGKILSERRTGIETAIREAEERKQKAASSLAEQQQKLAQAQAEIAKIHASASEAATKAQAEIMAKAEQDILRMRENASQELNTEQERVMNELRQRVVALALQKVEADLPARLGDDTQRNLVNRSIAMLGGAE